MSMLTAFLLGAACVGVLVPGLVRLAPALGLLDKPDVRKLHVGLVPLVGGLAMFLAFLLVTAMSGSAPALHRAFYLGALMMLTIGVVDDRRPLPSVPRFLLQGLTLWLVVHYTGNVLADVGMLVSPTVLELGPWAVPFTVFGFLGVVNAVNLVDGADGLAGGVAFTALLSFLAVLLLMNGAAGHASLRVAMAGLAGAVAGFLAFNLRTPWRRRAAIFMGDGGSLFLGFVLGWFAIYLCSPLAGPDHLAPVSAVWILIVPLIDTVSCMLRRALSLRSPMSADRQHLHHLLQAWGLSPAQTVALMIALNGLGGAVGVAVWWYQVPEYWAFAATLALLALYMAVAAVSWRRILGRAALPAASGAAPATVPGTPPQGAAGFSAGRAAR